MMGDPGRPGDRNATEREAPQRDERHGGSVVAGADSGHAGRTCTNDKRCCRQAEVQTGFQGGRRQRCFNKVGGAENQEHAQDACDIKTGMCFKQRPDRGEDGDLAGANGGDR